MAGTDTARFARRNVELWQMLASCAGAVLLTIAGGYFTFARDIMTKSEIKELIQTRAPYAHAKERIELQIDQNSVLLEKQSVKINSIQIQMQSLEGDRVFIKRLSQKVDDLVTAQNEMKATLKVIADRLERNQNSRKK